MITIHFDFKQFREESDLEQLNALLNVMPLQELRLENGDGYLCVTKDGCDRLLGHRYGLDGGSLSCTLARWSPGYHYQIDTFTKPSNENHPQQIQNWVASHPDRNICYAVVEEFEGYDGYMIVHRSVEKNHNQPQRNP